MQTLKYVDDILKTSEEEYKNDRRIIYCYLFCSQIFLPMQLYFAYILDDVSLTILAMYSYSLYTNLGLTGSELQYITLCQIIRSRFKLINKNINAMKKHFKSESKDFAEEIELFRHAHLILTKLAEHTNKVYDIRLFFSFFCCMTNVLSNLYFMIFGDTSFFDPADSKVIAITLLWALYYTVRLTLICLASQMLCKEVFFVFFCNMFFFIK